VNIEAQLRQPSSLLRWVQRFIQLRKEHPVFGLGTYEALRADNTRIFAHVRRYEDDIVLCVHNVARSAQAVELDLSQFAGMVPEEMFGQTRFPPIGDLPYLLTLGPHSFYWFVLERAPLDGAGEAVDDPSARTPTLSVPVHWETLVTQTARSSLTEVLPTFMTAPRW